jgi:hypothetical protein
MMMMMMMMMMMRLHPLACFDHLLPVFCMSAQQKLGSSDYWLVPMSWLIAGGTLKSCRCPAW